jgi:asparagine synthase (glutamine-hydrolysing)
VCGIAGIVGPGASRERVVAMTDRLRHRGPDDAGTFEAPGVCLGHRRLAIIDLSSAGHQPMTIGDLTLVYNGEIYNYRALRAELGGEFTSGSDTEVLLRLWAREGARCLGRLHGMFAFAIWDTRTRTLFAARDRLGIKPFFYAATPDGIAFASEPKALLALGARSLEPSAIVDFLTYKYVPTPKTPWQGIASLPAAHTLRFDGTLAIERFWQPVSTETPREDGAAVEEFSALFREAVVSHTVADTAVGVFLSGGLDSTAIVSHLETPETFTVGFDAGGREDAQYARLVAQRFGTRHHEETVAAPDLEKALDAMPAMYDAPFGDSSGWATFVVAQATRRFVKVALSGEGGDELLSGYGRYGRFLAARPSAAARLLARALPPFSSAARSLHRRGARGLDLYETLLSVFPLPQKRALIAPGLVPDDYDHLWALRRHWREDLSPLKRLQWLDLHTYLPDDLLVKADRASMAVSLEVRPPFLDHRLVELALSLEPRLLRRGDADKWILRRGLEGRVPAEVLARGKQGFSMPVRRWVREAPGAVEPALRRLARAGLLRSAARPRLGGEQLWSLLVLDRWSQHAGLV